MSVDNTQMNKNQDIQTWGGKRPGAGRPKGSTKKPKFGDYITEEQAHAVVAALVADALNGKTDAQKYVADQYFGKALQSQELSGKDGADLMFTIAEAISTKHGIADTETE